MKALAKFEAVAAIVPFALIFVCGLVGQVALVKCAILLCFFILGLSSIGLMLHAFISLQIRIGNGALPMVRFLADHETGVTLASWGFLSLGILIALPFMPIGAAKG